MIGLFGGSFDPPHNGHVALLTTAKRQLDLEEFLVVVAGYPGHKTIETSASTRAELARAAFPGEAIVLDDHPRTIDMIRTHAEWEGATFLLGADEFAGFLDWKEPERLLELVRLGVATRPGYPRERLDAVLARLPAPDRVRFFDIEPLPIASRELRARLDRGEDVQQLIPGQVWDLIKRNGLYGYSDRR